ncbi:bacterial Ig-like domain-containing protein [bacterium]|jgi:prepilin-type N-terminal cleavage/methylation domain-containing protein|nr:bacterial Ig-like domain-containing protein [bacterium]
MSKIKAFTLVEIIITIAIIGIMASIIYINYINESSYQSTLTKAKTFAVSVPLSILTSFVSTWKFDGSTAISSPATTADLFDSWGDASGTSVSGTVVLGEDSCIFGKCIYFNGTSDVISTGSSEGILNKKSNWTISAWVKPDANGGKDCFYSEGEGSNTIFNACITADNNISVSIYRGGVLEEITTSASVNKINRGKWNYIVISLMNGDSSGILKFWLNGDLIFSTNNQSKIDYTSSAIQGNIGASVNGADYFKGAIDDIQIYSDYVSSAAISSTTRELVSIAITSPASKTSYAINDTLDINGLIVTGTYTDSTTNIETITTSNITGFNSSSPVENQVLTITFNGKTTTYNISVVPTIPTNLACYGSSATTVSCSWTAVSGSGITYRLRVDSSDSNIISSSTIPAYSSGLTCNTNHNYEIKACSGSACSNYSATVSASTLVCPPVAPASLTCSTNSKTAITCSWPTSTGATAYDLERNGSSAELLTNTRADTDLTCGTSYTYRVRAKNAGGNSGWVATSPATTTTAICAPIAPTSLTCTPASGTSMNCSWTASEGATSYVLKRGLSTVYNNSGTSFTDSSLICGTSYNYQVQACDGTDCSGSTTTSATTVVCPPAIPATLTCTGASASLINCSWSSVSGTTLYQLQRDGTTIQNSSATSKADSGILCDTYAYQVNACNAGGCSGWKTATGSTIQCYAVKNLNISTGIQIASSSDFSRIYYHGGTGSNTIYGSSDFGTTWSTASQPQGSATSYYFEGLAASGNGSRLLAGSSSGIDLDLGRLFVSSDYGATWTETQPSGNVTVVWSRLAISNDGSKMYAAGYNGPGYSGWHIYLSTNYGTTWTELTGIQRWLSFDISTNGAYVYASNATENKLYKSSDYGTTWAEIGSYANDLSVSGDGARIIYSNTKWSGSTIVSGGNLYLSSNYGATITEIFPAGSGIKGWRTQGMSSNGARMIAGIRSGRIYMSLDYGSTWSEIRPLGDVNTTLSGVRFSTDGSRVLLIIDGVLYLGTFLP